MVALWVRLWQAYILIHVEGEYMLERNLASLYSLNDFCIHAYW